MDVGCSLEPAVASTMTLQHHSGSDLPPKKQNQSPTLQMRNSVRMDTHMPINSMSRCQNTLYTSSMDVGCSLKPPVASTMTLQHHSGSDLPPKKNKICPPPAQAYQCKGKLIWPFTLFQASSKTL